MSPTVTEVESPLRVMSLHALDYCHRLFYLEEVEELRVADDRVYAGRELHASLAADEEGEQTQLELADPELGLFGKVDAIRRRDGSILPYEHKRGRCRRGDNGPEAWPSDRLQVIAYAALIASATGQPVVEGRVRYHADNVTVRVPFDDAARAELAEAIATARRLRATTERPPVTENERLCVRCSLAPVCLPEEVRQAEHPDREPLRLFPPDRDGTSLHVLTPGATVGRSGEQIVIRYPDDTPEDRSPIRELDAVLLHGYVQITTQALHLCHDHDVAVHWLTTSGRYISQRGHQRRPGPATGAAVSRTGRRGDLPAPGQGAGPRQGRGPAPVPAPRPRGAMRRRATPCCRTWSRSAPPWRRSKRPTTATGSAAWRGRRPSGTSAAWRG